MSIKQEIKTLVNIKDLKINAVRENKTGYFCLTLNFTKEQFLIFKNWVQENQNYNQIFTDICKKYLINESNYLDTHSSINVFVDLKY